MADKTCRTCGRPIIQGVCLMSCPAKGGTGQALALLDQAKRQSAAAGRRVQFGHPSQWPEPPDQEFML